MVFIGACVCAYVVNGVMVNRCWSSLVVLLALCVLCVVWVVLVLCVLCGCCGLLSVVLVSPVLGCLVFVCGYGWCFVLFSVYRVYLYFVCNGRFVFLLFCAVYLGFYNFFYNTLGVC